MENDMMRIIMVVMSIALLGAGGFFAFFRQNMKQSLQMVFIWVMVFIGLTLAYTVFKR